MMEPTPDNDQKMIAALSDIYQVFDDVPFAVAALKGPDLIIDYINQYNLDFWQKKREEVIGKPLFEARPDLGEGAAAIHRDIYATGKRFKQDAVPFHLTTNGKQSTTYFNVVIDPIRTPEGEIIGQMATSVEVTDQVMAQQKAEEWETYFRNIADAIPSTLWMTDKEGNCTFLNKRWTTITGQTANEFKGTGWLNTLHPDDKSAAWLHFLASNQQQIPFKLLFRIKELKGAYIWVIASGEPRYNRNGQFEGYAGALVDINDQVIANERFELLNKATQDAIWEWDLVHNMVIWNDAFYKMFDYAREQVAPTGEWWYQHIHPDDHHRVVSGIHEAIDSGKQTWTDEYRFRCSDGSFKSVYDRGFIQYDTLGKPLRMVGSMQDNTEERLAEAALRKSEQRFERAVKAMEGIIWTNNAHGEMVGEQPAWSSLTGQRFEEYQRHGWVNVIHPDDVEPSLSSWRQAVKNKTTYVFEHRIRRKDHTWGTYAIRAIPLFNDKGDVIEWVGVHTDVTEQRKAESDLRESENRYRELAGSLEQLVAKRTHALQESNHDLQQFAHVTSHDLKEPVRKILLFTDRAKTELETLSADNLPGYLSKIEKSARRMYSMIDSVLLYSTMQGAGDPRVTIDLNLVMKDIKGDLEVLIAEKQAAINCSVLPCVQGAPVLIYQLFYNLISNSLKFSRAGVAPQIDVIAETVTGQMLEQYQLPSEQSFVCITITDNGIGFREYEAVRIFDAFLRLHPKDKYEGSGLGLSLCKKIVERHDGIIRAKGTEDVGATFQILLPVDTNTPAL